MKFVEVYLEGGVIQDIAVPEDVTVIVYDYDIQGADVDRITTDANGDECLKTVWKI